MSDYSYIRLSITRLSPDSSATEPELEFGAAIPSSTNFLQYFLNADEVFCLDNRGADNIVRIFARIDDSACIIASIAMPKDSKVSAGAVVKLLRECVRRPDLGAAELLGMYGFATRKEHREYPETQRADMAMALRTYASTAELVELVKSRLAGGDSHVGQLVLADATSVPADDSVELPRLRTATLPDFEIEITPQVRPAEPKRPLKSYYYTDDTEEEPEELHQPSKGKKRSNLLVTILLAVVALGIGWAIVRYLPDMIPSTSYDNIEMTNVSELQQAPVVTEPAVADTLGADTAAKEPADTLAAQAPVADEPEAATSAESEDIEYLNSNRVWKRPQLKSDKYKAFFDLFATGELYEIANADYFAVEGQCSNKTAEKAVKLIWQAYKTPTHQSNRRELRKLKGAQEIDLQKLVNTLALYRDKNPNNSPRPKR